MYDCITVTAFLVRIIIIRICIIVSEGGGDSRWVIIGVVLLSVLVSGHHHIVEG